MQNPSAAFGLILVIALAVASYIFLTRESPNGSPQIPNQSKGTYPPPVLTETKWEVIDDDTQIKMAEIYFKKGAPNKELIAQVTDTSGGFTYEEAKGTYKGYQLNFSFRADKGGNSVWDATIHGNNTEKMSGTCNWRGSPKREFTATKKLDGQ